jgi:hypothetical protein
MIRERNLKLRLMRVATWVLSPATLILASTFALASCGGPNMDMLAVRASHDLDCPTNQLVSTPINEDGDSWGMRGCERNAGYSWSTESGRGEWIMTKKPEADPSAKAPTSLPPVSIH